MKKHLSPLGWILFCFVLVTYAAAQALIPSRRLATTGVSAATYGSATQSAQIAVNAQGQITSASNVLIGNTPQTWSSGPTYSSGNVVQGSDGNYYRSLVNSNNGNDPTNDGGSNWEGQWIVVSATLNVGASARFTTIPGAFNFIKNAYIGNSATVTIQVANGSYSFSSTIDLSHSCGARIQLLGNTTTPSSCALTWTAAVNGISVSNAQLGLIDGFTLTGSTTTGFAAGIIAQQNGVITTGSHISVTTWGIGVTAFRGGVLVCRSITASSNGEGIVANDNGYVDATSAIANSNTTIGILSQHKSLVIVTSATANTSPTGFSAALGSFIDATSSSSTSTTPYSPAINTVGNDNSYVKK